MFTINIEDSIISSLGYNGDSIDGKYYYLVLKTYVKNNSSKSMKLDYDNFNVMIGSKRLKPILDRSTYFLDYAEPYYGDYLKSGEEKEISLAYKLEKDQIKKSFKLQLLSSFNTDNQKLVPKYAIVNLTPVVLDKVTDLFTVDMGSKLVLNNTNVGNTIFTVNDFIVSKSYMYEYTYCYSENNCKSIKDIANIDYTKGSGESTLLVLGYDFDLDKESTYGKTLKNDFKFFDDFVSVKSGINGTYNEYDAINVTPKNLNDKLILQVKGDIQDADDLDLLITIRNKRYTINLK